MNFQRKRWQRIVPGYWTMIGVYLVLSLCSIMILNSNVLGTSINWKNILVNVLLLNGVVPGKANNLVVRGGWYVGTSVVLWLLMPLMYRIYNHTSTKWKKVRIWLFPLLISIGVACVMIVSSKIDSRFYCNNNSFVYFSFVNQLPTFSIGFALYDWKKNHHTDKRLLKILLCIAFAVSSVVLFFSGIEYAFVFVPTVFAAFFCTLFSLTADMIEKYSNRMGALQKWGEYSFAVYLTHSLIVYEGSTIIRYLCKIILPNCTHTIVFIIWLPIAYLMVYFVGQVFTKYLSVWKRMSKGLLRRNV